MDFADLQIPLEEIWNEEDSGGTFYRLSRLVGQNNWSGIANLVGDEFAEKIRKMDESIGRNQFVTLLKEVAERNTERFSREIKQALKDASSFQLRGSLGDIWIQLERRADDHKRKSNLLALALADRLTDLIFPAAERAATLSELVVREGPTPEAEKYLEEACLCYFYELYSASAVMCRAVLEEVIEMRIKQRGINPAVELGEDGCTLGALLGLAKRPEFRSSRIIVPEAWHEVEVINNLGSRAVHGEPLPEKSALDCLMAARHALACILK